MKATPVFLWFMIFVSTGCVQTQPDAIKDKTTTIAIINKRAANSAAELTFKNGESRVVTKLNIGTDTLSWRDIDSVNVHRMPISSITTVAFSETESVLQRGLSGAVLGMIGGGLVGYGVGSVKYSRELAKEIHLPTGIILGAGAGGLLGMLTTIPTGVVYEFQQFKKVKWTEQ